MNELFTSDNLKVLAGVVQSLVILVGAIIYLKKGQTDKAAELIEGVVEQAISIGRNAKNQGFDGDALKLKAVEFAKDKLLTDTRVVKALDVLNITATDEVISHYVDVAFHAGKLGLQNTLKKAVKGGM